MRNRDVFPRLSCPVSLAKARWQIVPFAAYNNSACESSRCYLAVHMASMYIIKLISSRCSNEMVNKFTGRWNDHINVRGTDQLKAGKSG